MNKTKFKQDSEQCDGCLLGTSVCPVFHSYGERAAYTNSGVGLITGFYHMEQWGLEPDRTFIQSTYECTNCGACEQICPKSLKVVDLISHIRHIFVERNLIRSLTKEAFENTFKHGNPWGNLQSKRGQWTEHSYIKTFPKTDENTILLYMGCILSYDPRCQEIARSIVSVLNKAEVDYGILGNDEKCCGDQIMRMGERGLFEMLAEQNIKLFDEHDIQRIITMSPHSYNTFKHDYPQLGGDFKVQHYTQFISELIDEGRIKFTNRIDKVVTYHDPCFLGRHNDVYDEPRKIIESIPGLKLVEMSQNRENSLCCGGGGGRMWIDEKSEEHVSTIRAREAINVNPDIVATACPFCLINLEDGIKTLNKYGEIMVKDIAELLNEAI